MLRKITFEKAETLECIHNDLYELNYSGGFDQNSKARRGWLNV